MNDKMLEYLEKFFVECEILSFDAKDNQIMCFPYTINIAVQHVLKQMSSVEAPDNDEDNPEDLTGEANADENRRFGQTFEAACAQDPITCICKIVTAIRGSRQRHEACHKLAITGDLSCNLIMKPFLFLPSFLTLLSSLLLLSLTL